jgi:hypothetical protein
MKLGKRHIEFRTLRSVHVAHRRYVIELRDVRRILSGESMYESKRVSESLNSAMIKRLINHL